MSDHEFEKQVQRKLDELKLRPSNAVWTAIEQDIRQHKPRRRFKFWLPLGVVAVAVTGYLFYANQAPKAEALAQAKNIQVNHSNNNDSEKTSTQHFSGSKEQAVYNDHSAEGADKNKTSVNQELAGGNTTANNKTASDNSTRNNTTANGITANNEPANNTSANNTTAHKAAANNKSADNISSNNIKADNQTANNNTTTNRPTANVITANNKSANYKNANNTATNHTKASNTTASNTTNTTGNHAPTHNISNTGNLPIQHYLRNRHTSKPLTTHNPATSSENNDQLKQNKNSSIASPEADLSASAPQPVANTTETIATEKAITDSLGKTRQLFPATESAAKTLPIQKQQPPKWRFGVMGTAGISRITQSNLFQLNGWLGSGALSQEKNKAEDLAQGSSFAAPNGPQASNNGLINTAPPPRRQAAAITQGFSWSAGVFAQRPLTRRLRLTIGLQYSYRSAHTTIGKLVNQPVVVSQAYTSGTVVNRYYTSLDALQMGNGLSTNSQFNLATIPRDSLLGRDYTYRFHAIEVPVTINWQINKGRQLPPFVLDAGLSIGKLLTTDALHYDGRGDIYYKDNSLLTKTQVNALMGLNVGLFQQSRLPIWVGPHLRYSLTGLVKKDVSNGQYLWATGIQVRMLLNPSKK